MKSPNWDLDYLLVYLFVHLVTFAIINSEADSGEGWGGGHVPTRKK